MSKRRDLPKRVQEKHGAYYHVKAEGPKRIWTRLSAVRDGLPAMYRALADVEARDVLDDSMPRLIQDWLRDVSSRRTKKTQANDAYQTRNIARAFAEFRAPQIRAPHIVEFLQEFRDKPRSHNAHRSMIRELMRYAEERGFREPGTNPVDSLRIMKTPPRRRYITDSELRRIKVGICYGKDGKRTPSGPMICCLVEMAYLTGQRASDLLSMEWSEIGKAGILFQPGKTLASTGVAVMIGWTPRLQRLVARLRAFGHANSRHVFCKQDGSRYTYSGASTAWKRGLARAGIPDTQFRDLRAKALTDVDAQRGIVEAQRMGAHSTQAQTADYVRHKSAIKTSATR
ncbi:tyrosine-type recombinase/integrase [Acidovorax sp. PRC11]|uniref:tyrosine-type recombinase/integrase n=1 Tax=Acidovorax sp. PRC11 TaxID=2962592 RepID=UPI002881851C|nr:tyrosine-type recombinase/integrase [Acidovorax sp. PRC11]MDT0137757.1 tyrosine-type recombinase/integrase [Acidovorax sp. PRC11]